MQSMQAELAKLDPKALEQLPAELKEQLAKGVPGSRRWRDASRIGRGLPGLGGGLAERPARPRRRNAEVSRASRKEKMNQIT